MNGQERNNNVALTGPGGWGLKIGGRDTIIILLLAMTLAWLVWTTRQEHLAIVNELGAVSYFMSIPADERPRLPAPPVILKRLKRR